MTRRLTYTSSTAFVLLLAVVEARTAEIRIENAGPESFTYEMRRQESTTWSVPYSLSPGGHHVYQIEHDRFFVIRFPSGPQTKAYALRPGKVYRYDVASGGTGDLYIAPPGPTPPAEPRKQSDSPNNADQPHEPIKAKPDREIRELKLLVIADRIFRRRFGNGWKDRVQRITSAASRFYEAKFSVQLTVAKFQEWDYSSANSDADSETAPEDLKTTFFNIIPPPGVDLLVAFIGSVPATEKIGHLERFENGFSVPFSQYILVVDHHQDLWGNATVVLIHELGHVFGAFHVDTRGSVMRPFVGSVPLTYDFDEFNAQVLRLTRMVDLRTGVTSLNPDAAKRIRVMSDTQRISKDQGQPDPVTAGFLFQLDRAIARNDFRVAKDLAGRAGDYVPDDNKEVRDRIERILRSIAAAHPQADAPGPSLPAR